MRLKISFNDLKLICPTECEEFEALAKEVKCDISEALHRAVADYDKERQARLNTAWEKIAAAFAKNTEGLIIDIVPGYSYSNYAPIFDRHTASLYVAGIWECTREGRNLLRRYGMGLGDWSTECPLTDKDRERNQHKDRLTRMLMIEQYAMGLKEQTE